VGQVTEGPELRRGVSDLDGRGEAVSGIVIMRHGENALEVIERVKAKLAEIEPGLPPGVKVIPVYDRSDLIHRAIDTLRGTLIEIMATVALVILIFLWHPASSIIPLVTIPVAVLVSFIGLRAMGISANIMSLGGIAIAMGALVDAAIVMVEQTHKKLELWQRTGEREDYRSVIIGAVREVGRPSFFALLVMAVAFVPVLTLEAQEGRLFRPLAYTVSLTLIVAAILAITLDPALRLLFTRVKPYELRPRWLQRFVNAVAIGRIHAEEQHPLTRLLIRIYQPVAAWSLRRKSWVIGAAFVLVLITIPVYQKLGWEFMPPLDEGSLLYMPTTLPGISVGEAQRLLQVTDRIIRQFPEVERVFGKAGRAETSTDPAPLSMLETVVLLKPTSEWRKVDTWYSSWAPDWAKALFRRVTPDHISREALVREMNSALTLPGVANTWTMPIRGRIDMLSTGIRTPVGLKISGASNETIEAIGAKIEALLPSVDGTRTVFAERTGTGYFLDIDWKRDELARHGLSIEEAQGAVQNAIGGENVTTTIEGRERYPVNVRYMRDFRSDIGALERVLVAARGGERQIPLGQLATVRTVSGPSMIRNEDGLLTGYVYIDLAGRDAGGYVEEAARLVRDNVTLPPGYAIEWSGEYESIARVKDRLLLIVPLTLALILLLLYLNTRSLTKTFIVLLAVPFSAIGAIWLVYLLGYNLSVGVWVGLIALLGVDAATGVFMLLYLDLAYEQAKGENRLTSLAALRETILQGAAKRLRPKFMTVSTLFLGLIPIMWAVGAGSDLMKRVAAPMIGGVFTSFALELLVYPAVYELWKWHTEVKRQVASAS
jgi:Cu(I)/Ag(I) efflux system membrane protein CusA/SilA